VSGYRLCRVVDAGQILGGMMTGLECWQVRHAILVIRFSGWW
jgi:hypothetical protein